MTVDLAAADDLGAIMALEASFEHARWSEQAWSEELASERTRVAVDRDPSGAVVGVATFALAGDVADLNRVVVAPEQRQQGIGRRLVLDGLAWAESAGARQVMLEVDADNDPARLLYEQVGFSTLARRAHYYGPGRDALVMALSLESES